MLMVEWERIFLGRKHYDEYWEPSNWMNIAKKKRRDENNLIKISFQSSKFLTHMHTLPQLLSSPLWCCCCCFDLLNVNHLSLIRGSWKCLVRERAMRNHNLMKFHVYSTQHSDNEIFSSSSWDTRCMWLLSLSLRTIMKTLMMLSLFN